MNKFEDVSSDDHQISVAGAGAGQGKGQGQGQGPVHDRHT